ncbi:MAG: YkgJ family cysteine cluster protein [Deltaproteobacteria bacterium]|nr:YkgJ family cysteine cluster protein [Deltaproteobacteria bacterium]MCW5801347.1 YkgJ family cysteine cluster protein [Deltaproteobacteria bacterium]
MNRLGEVVAKVDAFFARVEARHGADMQCRTGCADCCRTRLTVTGVEAAAIRAEVAAWPAERRRALRDLGDDAGRCRALDEAGRCRIYAARPLVCRSHGAPIKIHQGGLPVIQSCFRNFTATAPDADCVLDQTTLSAMTLAVDRAAGGDGSRVDLAELISELVGGDC